MERSVGAIVGMIVGLILAALLIKLCNRNKKIKSQYDERQELIRGRAYKYGFYSVMLYSLLVGAFSIGDIYLPVSSGVVCFIGLILGIGVLAVYSIWNDAYWGLNNNRGRYLILFLAGTVINLAFGILAIINGEMIVDGELKGSFINLLCGLMLILIGIVLLVKKIVVSGKNEEDE